MKDMIMQAHELLHKLFGSSIHGSRRKSFCDVVLGIMQIKKLKLTHVGRAMSSKIQEKSGIKKVDRLLGNSFFHKCPDQLYGLLIKALIKVGSEPVIVVDWSKLPNVEEKVLRASLATKGRALTLYEEVHPRCKEGTRKVHNLFLKRLKKLLPNCKPIIVSDAGFKNPWFKEVLKLGWHYVGRVRGKTKYSEGKSFEYCQELHKKGKRGSCYLGEKILSRKNSLRTNFFIISHKLVGRKCYTKSGKIKTDKDSKNYSRSYREPWLLVSSLEGARMQDVFRIYKQRMAIEESFRDLKSSEYGLNMQSNKTLLRKRLITWLLLAAFAHYVAYVLGWAAEKMKLHYNFQANTIRHRRTLSFFYLGCQIIRKKINIPICISEFICFTREAICQC
jgi:hypothetical protein